MNAEAKSSTPCQRCKYEHHGMTLRLARRSDHLPQRRRGGAQLERAKLVFEGISEESASRSAWAAEAEADAETEADAAAVTAAASVAAARGGGVSPSERRPEAAVASVRAEPS